MMFGVVLCIHFFAGGTSLGLLLQLIELVVCV